MARRPTDYTAQIQAADERRRLQEQKQRQQEQTAQQLRERQASSYGQVVLEVLGDRMEIEELAGRLLDTVEHAKATPQLKTEWAARGAEFFRPAGNGHRKPSAVSRTAPSRASGKEGQTPAPEPSRARPASPARAEDLLDALAPPRPGPGTPGEGAGHGEQP